MVWVATMIVGRLFGSRWTLSALGVQLVIAWTAAVVVFQLGRLM